MRTLPLCFYTLFLCDNCCGDVDELVNSYQSKMGREHFLTMRSPTILSSVVVSQPATHEKNNNKIIKKKTRSYSKHTIYIFMVNVFLESKIFHQTMFFYSKLYTTPRRHICFVWHAVFHLQAISSRPLPWFALKCDLKSKLQRTFTFFTSVTQSKGPLRKTRASFSGYKRSRL